MCITKSCLNLKVAKVVKKNSNVLYNAEQHALLFSNRNSKSLNHQQPIITFELQGHIFFGSAIRMANFVKRGVYILAPPNTALTKASKKTNSDQINSQNICDLEKIPLLSHHLEERNLIRLDGSIAGTEEGCSRGATKFVIFDFKQV